MILDCNPAPISLTNLTLLGLFVDATVASLGLFADVPVALLLGAHCIFRGNRMIRAGQQRRTATQSNAKQQNSKGTTKQQNNQQSNRYTRNRHCSLHHYLGQVDGTLSPVTHAASELPVFIKQHFGPTYVFTLR